ncbi:MAG: hypothetical protein FWE21_08530 [Defluviitaleaceae bacterium]|nr:hypothetical protein [Defluviitaleaceae bacterium]
MNLSTEGKILLKGVLIISAASALVGLFLVPAQTIRTTNVFGWEMALQLQVHNRISFALGVALAALVSIIKIFMLERTANKAMEMDASKASIYMGASYLPRMVLTGVALVASVIFLGIFGIFGALVGTMSLTVSVYISKMLESRKSNKKTKGKE